MLHAPYMTEHSGPSGATWIPGMVLGESPLRMPRLRSPAHSGRRARVESYVLHQRQGALTYERYRHELGKDSVACGAAGRVESVEAGQTTSAYARPRQGASRRPSPNSEVPE